MLIMKSIALTGCADWVRRLAGCAVRTGCAGILPAADATVEVRTGRAGCAGILPAADATVEVRTGRTGSPRTQWRVIYGSRYSRLG